MLNFLYTFAGSNISILASGLHLAFMILLMFCVVLMCRLWFTKKPTYKSWMLLYTTSALIVFFNGFIKLQIDRGDFLVPLTQEWETLFKFDCFSMSAMTLVVVFLFTVASSFRKLKRAFKKFSRRKREYE